MRTARYIPQNANRSLPAFSLVELLAVIAIMAVLLAVAVPLLSDPAKSTRAHSLFTPTPAQ